MIENKISNTSWQGGKYTYSALEDDGSTGVERMEMERKTPALRNPMTRDTAGMAARNFCRRRSRYSVSEHLQEIGSRIDKNWFLVGDVEIKTERLMTLLPIDDSSPINPRPVAGTKDALIELFQALQHPYIYPVLDVDFLTISSQSYLITIIPSNPKGSLKDLIYRSQWNEDWAKKYKNRSAGLPHKQVQRLGRQILEALLYLQDRGFPPCGHIHSGNIILQNGVARISGLENTIAGLTSRLFPTIRKRLKENWDAIDSLCYGHLLFEMCAGYELSSSHPTQKNYEDIVKYSQVITVLEFIFGYGENYPSIEEILCCDLFRNFDLREMRAMPLPAHFQLPYSTNVRLILKDVRKHQKQKSQSKRTATALSMATEAGSTSASSDASTSNGCALPITALRHNDQSQAYESMLKNLSLADHTLSTEHLPHFCIFDNTSQNFVSSSPPEIYHTPPLSPPLIHNFLPPNHQFSPERTPLLCTQSQHSAQQSNSQFSTHKSQHSTTTPILSHKAQQSTNNKNKAKILKFSSNELCMYSDTRNGNVKISDNEDKFFTPYYTPRHNNSILDNASHIELNENDLCPI